MTYNPDENHDEGARKANQELAMKTLGATLDVLTMATLLHASEVAERMTHRLMGATLVLMLATITMHPLLWAVSAAAHALAAYNLVRIRTRWAKALTDKDLTILPQHPHHRTKKLATMPGTATDPIDTRTDTLYFRAKHRRSPGDAA